MFVNRLFCFLVCIGVALLTAFLSARWFTHGHWNLAAADSVVVEGNLDFGEVVEKPNYSLPVTLFNVTDSDIEIERFLTSCACAVIEPPRISIPANSKVTVAAKIDLLLPPPKKDEPTLYQDLKIMIGVFAKAKDLKVAKWTIRGRVLRTLSLSAYDVNFEDVEPGNQVAKMVSLVPNFPVDFLEVTTRNSTSKLYAILSKEEDPGNAVLSLTLKPTAASGPFDEQLLITWAHPGKVDGGATAIKVKGKITSLYFLDPPALLLTPLEVGSSATEVLTLTHKNGRKFSIEELEPASKDTTLTLAESGEGTVRRIHVTQKVTALRDSSTCVRILLVDSEGRHEWLSFDILCTGLRNGRV